MLTSLPGAAPAQPEESAGPDESQGAGEQKQIVGGGADPVEDTVSYFASIGPAARALREMDEPARTGFSDRLRELASRNLRDGLVSLRAAAWIVTARGP